MVMTRPSSGRLRAVSWEWIWHGAALLAVGLILGFMLLPDRQAIDAAERDRLRVQAGVIAKNLGRQLEGLHSAPWRAFVTRSPVGIATIWRAWRRPTSRR